MQTFDGKALLTAIDTGASTGFGHAVACNALDHGEIVVATMRDPSVDSLASKYPGYTKKGKLLILKLDVTNLAELGTVFETVRERLGRVDVVFNNAGCMQTIGEVEQVPENLGRSLFDVCDLFENELATLYANNTSALTDQLLGCSERI
jgi:NAD(P)-dependent dehydrogenase (short-subunit alcohol dehydrogenase family)